MPLVTLLRRVEAVRQRLRNPLAMRPLLSLYLYALIGLPLLASATYMILVVGRLQTRQDATAHATLIDALQVLMYAMHFVAHTLLLRFLYLAHTRQRRYIAQVNAMAYSAALAGRGALAERKEMRLLGGPHSSTNNYNNNNNNNDYYYNNTNGYDEEEDNEDHDGAYKRNDHEEERKDEEAGAGHEHTSEAGMSGGQEHHVRQKNAFANNGAHIALRRRGAEAEVEMVATSSLPQAQVMKDPHTADRATVPLAMRQGTSSALSSALSATTMATADNGPHSASPFSSTLVRKPRHSGHGRNVSNESDDIVLIVDGEAGHGGMRRRLRDAMYDEDECNDGGDGGGNGGCCCCCCCCFEYCCCFTYLGGVLHRWGSRYLPPRVMACAVRYGAWLWLLLPLYMLYLPYFVASCIISPRYTLTFGILTVSAQCLLNGLLALTALTTLALLSVRLTFAYANRYGRRGRLFKRACWLLFFLVLLYLGCCVLGPVERIRNMDTLAELRRGILSDHVDPCAAEGAMLDPVLRHSWVWPAITPRRLFNLFTGSEMCHDESWRPMGYVDAESDLLIVSAHCADGTAPHIFLDRPERSELSGKRTAFIPESKRANAQYQRELEDLYGSHLLAEAAGVIVHRDPLHRHITAVELDPQRLKPTLRAPRTPSEAAARAAWPASKEVLQIELGRSAAYSVWCEAMNYEEYFVYPLALHPLANSNNTTIPTNTTRAPAEVNNNNNATEAAGQTAANHTSGTHQAAQATTTTTAAPAKPLLDEPASNLLFIVFDAVSRQGVARMLPKFTAWMRRFQATQQAKPTTQPGHYVIEAQAHTTMEHSTAGNFVPYLTGTTDLGSSSNSQSDNRFDAVWRSVFNLVKERHGELMSTAFTTGYCGDFFESMFHYTVPSSGRGGRIRGVDRYLFQPFCHLEYTAKESILQGQYSILRRCIDHRYVHEHVLDYTTYLLRQDLRWQNTSRQYFFDLSYFMEGHEGTHGVLPLVDDALTAFMEHLQRELGFFDNPLNSLIFAADHGNHMGHYYELTRAGRYERTTPAMIYIVHPEVMRRIDAQKGRPVGTAETNFLARTKRLTTPVDLYLTLCDLFNVRGRPNEKSETLALPPASLFDRRRDDKFVTDCKSFKLGDEGTLCSMDYCVPKSTQQ